MKFIAALIAAVACAIAQAKDVALEIRFHPAGARPYALASERGIFTLQVHNTAIINREAQPLTVTRIEFEILAADAVFETRRLGTRDRVRVRVQATVAGEALDATLENYFERVKQVQRQRLARGVRGVRGVVGNHVVIEHADGEHSIYAHLKPGSLKVKAGDRVAMGQPLASVGTSGNSTEPHLHFHIADGPDALRSAGIPVRFDALHIRNADFPRPPQTGDFLETR